MRITFTDVISLNQQLVSERWATVNDDTNRYRHKYTSNLRFGCRRGMLSVVNRPISSWIGMPGNLYFCTRSGSSSHVALSHTHPITGSRKCWVVTVTEYVGHTWPDFGKITANLAAIATYYTANWHEPNLKISETPRMGCVSETGPRALMT